MLISRDNSIRLYQSKRFLNFCDILINVNYFGLVKLKQFVLAVRKMLK